MTYGMSSEEAARNLEENAAIIKRALVEPEPRGLTGATTQFVELTYKVILPVSAEANWFIGLQPRSLGELNEEVRERRLHGHDITEQMTSVMSRTGKLGASGVVQRFTPGQLAAQQDLLESQRDLRD